MIDAEKTLPPSAADELVADIARRITGQMPCVLFLGAGVHAPPPETSPYEYPPQFRPPLGGPLAEKLSARCGCTADKRDHRNDDLQRASLCFEVRHGRKSLVELINGELRDARPSPALLALAELPFQLIVTTNYDDLLEQALQRHSKRPLVGVYDPAQQPTFNPSREQWSVERPFIFKIHGCISTRPESIVITDEDYINFVLRMGDREAFFPIPRAFTYHMSEAMNLFVGYSLMDYNLRLLFKTMRSQVDKANLPKTYSIDIRPDRLIREVWEKSSRYVEFVVENHWDFLPRLYKHMTGREVPA